MYYPPLSYHKIFIVVPRAHSICPFCMMNHSFQGVIFFSPSPLHICCSFA